LFSKNENRSELGPCLLYKKSKHYGGYYPKKCLLDNEGNYAAKGRHTSEPDVARDDGNTKVQYEKDVSRFP
jgi:hypothetical protein